MKIIVRTNASEEIGLGHLNRCLILADTLNGLSASTTILVNDASDARRYFPDSRAPIVSYEKDLEKWPKADACIVDLGLLDPKFYDELSEYYKKIILFDDANNSLIPRSVSAIINTNISVDKSAYPDFVHMFLGTEYFLLRNELFGREKHHNASNVVVCMGGSDPTNQSPRLVKILERISDRLIDVIIGPGTKEFKQIEAFEKMTRVKLHKNPRNFVDLVENAIFCVSGSGTMLYELAHLGVPTACLSLVEHQKPIAERFHRYGAAINLGHYSQVCDYAISNCLKELDSDKEKREHLSAKGQSLIDGKGANRLANRLVDWMKKECSVK